MKLTTKFNIDTTKSNTITTLEKFFQFIILDDTETKQCKVTIYNAIAFRNEQSNDKLIIEFFDENNAAITDLKFTDHSDFYSKSDVLCQFWGKDSEYTAKISNALERYHPEYSHEKSSQLHTTLSKNNGGLSGVFGVTEDKPHLKNVIIKPSQAKLEGNQVLLECNLQGISKAHIANGYWFKVEFTIDLDTNQNGFNFNSKIDFSDKSIFRSPDFKIYIQTNKKYDLRSSKVSIQDKDDQPEVNGEIVKIFSQSKIKYFSEWAASGIYHSSLFKANSGSSGEKNIREANISSISVSSEMENLELPRRREISLLIFSIIFSLFTAFGFDKTRQLGEFSSIFPTSAYISIDGLWAIVCLCALSQYHFIRVSNWPVKAKILSLMPIGTWFLTYLIFNDSLFITEILKDPDHKMVTQCVYTYLYYANIFIAMFFVFCSIVIKKMSCKIPPYKDKSDIRYYRLAKLVGLI